MKRIMILLTFIAVAMSLIAADSPDTRIIQSANRIKELAIQSKSIQKPEEAAKLLDAMHKEFLVVLDANHELEAQETELSEAREEELDTALVELLDSIEVITITATQFMNDPAVSKSLDDFEAEMEKFGQ